MVRKVEGQSLAWLGLVEQPGLGRGAAHELACVHKPEGIPERLVLRKDRIEIVHEMHRLLTQAAVERTSKGSVADAGARKGHQVVHRGRRGVERGAHGRGAPAV